MGHGGSRSRRRGRRVGRRDPPAAALLGLPYYAPLGAVVATTSTVARSVRESLQAVAAIVVGALVARGVDLVLAPSALSIALVVAVATLVAGWGFLGEMGSWAVTSALFVLIIGNADKVGYMGAYVGLVVVGALVGIGINLLFPPLPLAASDVALARLRNALADQLEHLADGLDLDAAPSPEEWDERRLLLTPVLDRSRQSSARAKEAARANRRARRYAEATQAQSAQAEALALTSSVVADLTRLVTSWETLGRDDLAFGEPLRPLTRDALLAYADAVRSTAGRPPTREPDAGPRGDRVAAPRGPRRAERVGRGLLRRGGDGAGDQARRGGARGRRPGWVRLVAAALSRKEKNRLQQAHSRVRAGRPARGERAASGPEATVELLAA
ncbi:hypothetical protein NKG05_07675 [Oerskovia sp. M15]